MQESNYSSKLEQAITMERKKWEESENSLRQEREKQLLASAYQQWNAVQEALRKKEMEDIRKEVEETSKKKIEVKETALIQGIFHSQ